MPSATRRTFQSTISECGWGKEQKFEQLDCSSWSFGNFHCQINQMQIDWSRHANTIKGNVAPIWRELGSTFYRLQGKEGSKTIDYMFGYGMLGNIS